jgi:hypothetical protein
MPHLDASVVEDAEKRRIFEDKCAENKESKFGKIAGSQ